MLDAGGLRYEAAAQDLLAGAVEGDYPSLREARLAALGGSTQVWAGMCRPLDAQDMAARPWIAHSGWPFDRATLDDAYARAHAYLDLDRPEYDPATWEALIGEPRLAADDLDLTTVVFQQTPVRFGDRWRATLASASRIDVILHAAVLRLEPADTADRIERAEVAGPDGRRFAVRAGSFVLACGGIENARLLLLSGPSPEAAVGNARGLVGRFLSEHLFAEPGRLVPADATTPRGLYSPMPAGGGADARGALALRPATLERERLPNAAALLLPPHLSDTAAARPAAQALQRLWDKLRGRAVPGGELSLLLQGARAPRDLFRIAVGRLVTDPRRLPGPQSGPARLRMFVESPPRADHRVTLAADRDRLGRPRARLQWWITPDDVGAVRRTWDFLDLALRRSGAGRLELTVRDDEVGWRSVTNAGKHPMGTTRMHADPTQGVVDANARVHGTSNLFVAGSSVFPAGGYANPTLTIVALAIRLADYLKEATHTDAIVRR